MKTVTLYRPVGPKELALIESSGWRAFRRMPSSLSRCSSTSCESDPIDRKHHSHEDRGQPVGRPNAAERPPRFRWPVVAASVTLAFAMKQFVPLLCVFLAGCGTPYTPVTIRSPQEIQTTSGLSQQEWEEILAAAPMPGYTLIGVHRISGTEVELSFIRSTNLKGPSGPRISVIKKDGTWEEGSETTWHAGYYIVN